MLKGSENLNTHHIQQLISNHKRYLSSRRLFQRPSQNRTCGSPAYGSSIGCLASLYGAYIELMHYPWHRQRESFDVVAKFLQAQRFSLTASIHPLKYH